MKVVANTNSVCIIRSAIRRPNVAGVVPTDHVKMEGVYHRDPAVVRMIVRLDIPVQSTTTSATQHANTISKSEVRSVSEKNVTCQLLYR